MGDKIKVSLILFGQKKIDSKISKIYSDGNKKFIPIL